MAEMYKSTWPSLVVSTRAAAAAVVDMVVALLLHPMVEVPAENHAVTLPEDSASMETHADLFTMDLPAHLLAVVTFVTAETIEIEDARVTEMTETDTVATPAIVIVAKASKSAFYSDSGFWSWRLGIGL
jgi:hypothetical protein